jgi:deoxycytidylate deaminase
MRHSPYIFNILHELAVENFGVRNQFKMAAGIAYRGNLLATGLNSFKSHPMMRQWGKNEDSIFIHAEVDAIKNALKIMSHRELAKCDLYIARVKRPNTDRHMWVPGLAKPCQGCQRAIAAFDIRNVFYTHDFEEGGYRQIGEFYV